MSYDEWLKVLWPNTYSADFAPHHDDFWRHIMSIKRGQPAPAYFLILARGGGKDANTQGAIIHLGALKQRRFCLYVCATQELANKVVSTIGGMLESSTVTDYYPTLASRSITKYGHSRGWRVNLLRTASGFNVIGLGLDTSVRGLRLDELRPDLIVFSDVDSRKDSPETIEKKKDTITKDILPAGSSDACVLWIQNVMHRDSITKQVIDNKVDFLRNRIVNGPHKAIDDLECELGDDDLWHIVKGTPTWVGQGLGVCEKQINEQGYTNFMIESQHEVDLVEGGMYEHVDFERLRCDASDVPDLISIVAFCDPAVTETGDKQGIQVDGLGADDKVYRLWSWEENSTPADTIRLTIEKAIEYGAEAIGFETDQGGDLWEESYNLYWEEMIKDETYPKITRDTYQPDFIAARAGAIGSKKHRGQLQLVEYEKARFVHVRGTHAALEKALKRFPIVKPFDLHDAAFWAQWYLIKDAPAGN